MTKKEAQEFMGVSERTLDGYVKKHGLTVQYLPGKTGRRADYDGDELAKLKEQLEAPQATATGIYTSPDDEGAAGPQGGALVSLRGSAPTAGPSPLLVLSPEHFPALAQALLAEREAVPIADRLTLDLDGAAALSGFSRGTIRAAIGTGELPARRIGRGWKVERTALDAWVKALFAGEGA